MLVEFLRFGFHLIEEYNYFFLNSGLGEARRERGRVGCPHHRGGVGPGHMFIVRGRFGSPTI